MYIFINKKTKETILFTDLTSIAREFRINYHTLVSWFRGGKTFKETDAYIISRFSRHIKSNRHFNRSGYKV